MRFANATNLSDKVLATDLVLSLLGRKLSSFFTRPINVFSSSSLILGRNPRHSRSGFGKMSPYCMSCMHTCNFSESSIVFLDAYFKIRSILVKSEVFSVPYNSFSEHWISPVNSLTFDALSAWVTLTDSFRSPRICFFIRACFSFSNGESSSHLSKNSFNSDESRGIRLDPSVSL